MQDPTCYFDCFLIGFAILRRIATQVGARRSVSVWSCLSFVLDASHAKASKYVVDTAEF
jgi:hypothetical protein